MVVPGSFSHTTILERSDTVVCTDPFPRAYLTLAEVAIDAMTNAVRYATHVVANPFSHPALDCHRNAAWWQLRASRYVGLAPQTPTRVLLTGHTIPTCTHATGSRKGNRGCRYSRCDGRKLPPRIRCASSCTRQKSTRLAPLNRPPGGAHSQKSSNRQPACVPGGGGGGRLGLLHTPPAVLSPPGGFPPSSNVRATAPGPIGDDFTTGGRGGVQACACGCRAARCIGRPCAGRRALFQALLNEKVNLAQWVGAERARRQRGGDARGDVRAQPRLHRYPASQPTGSPDFPPDSCYRRRRASAGTC